MEKSSCKTSLNHWWHFISHLSAVLSIMFSSYTFASQTAHAEAAECTACHSSGAGASPHTNPADNHNLLSTSANCSATHNSDDFNTIYEYGFGDIQDVASDQSVSLRLLNNPRLADEGFTGGWFEIDCKECYHQFSVIASTLECRVETQRGNLWQTYP